MTILTIQFKHVKLGWQDRTIVTVLNPTVLEDEITALVAELPKDVMARVKVEQDGITSYRW